LTFIIITVITFDSKFFFPLASKFKLFYWELPKSNYWKEGSSTFWKPWTLLWINPLIGWGLELGKSTKKKSIRKQEEEGKNWLQFKI